MKIDWLLVAVIILQLLGIIKFIKEMRKGRKKYAGGYRILRVLWIIAEIIAVIGLIFKLRVEYFYNGRDWSMNGVTWAIGNLTLLVNIYVLTFAYCLQCMAGMMSLIYLVIPGREKTSV